VFGDRSILLLLDEFFYVENAMGLVVELNLWSPSADVCSEADRSSSRLYPNCLLVASQRSGISRRRGLLNVLDKVSRIDAKKEPVSGDEVMKVIQQRRLFADVGDAAVIQESLVNRLNFS